MDGRSVSSFPQNKRASACEPFLHPNVPVAQGTPWRAAKTIQCLFRSDAEVVDDLHAVDAEHSFEKMIRQDDLPLPCGIHVGRHRQIGADHAQERLVDIDFFTEFVEPRVDTSVVAVETQEGVGGSVTNDAFLSRKVVMQVGLSVMNHVGSSNGNPILLNSHPRSLRYMVNPSM